MGTCRRPVVVGGRAADGPAEVWGIAVFAGAVGQRICVDAGLFSCRAAIVSIQRMCCICTIRMIVAVKAVYRLRLRSEKRNDSGRCIDLHHQGAGPAEKR